MNREEAIKKIRWYLLGLVLTDDVREAFNTLIPELVEKGTDEKMLDAILCHVKASNDFTANGVSKEDVVAYLEGKKKKAAIESAYPTSMLAIPKFSVGDNVKYQGVTYEITKVEVNDIGPFYSARAIGPIDYDDEIKTIIGPGGEKDMVKVDPYHFEKERNEKRYDMVAKLEEHLANTPKEQLDAEWKALEKWNDVGPTVEEYIYGKTPKFKVGDKIRKIGGDYASWEITGINSILRLYEGKYEEGYPTELSFEEQDSYELATGDGHPVPELRESEDERIIRKMIEHFKAKTKETWCNMPVKDILAWLEKQKELFESGKGLYYYDGEKFTYCCYPLTIENPYDFAMSQQEKQKESLHISETCKEKVNSFTHEDERIREELVNFLQSPFIKENLTDEKVAPWIAYLEKQKENPKSADSIPSDCASDAKCEDKSPKHSDSDGTDIRDTPAYWKGWDDAMKQKEQKHPNGCFTCDEYKKGYEAGRLNGFTAGYNKAMKEIDQKEQKPLTPEEKVKHPLYIEGFEAGKEVGAQCEKVFKEQKPVPKFSVGDYVIDTNYKGEPLYQIVGIDKECYICEYRGDKEMGDRTVMHFAFNNPYLRLEQKPAEWSFPDGVDETVDELISIAECLEMDGDCLFNEHTGTECGKFLRDLARKQVECKPAEWSEEEKQKLNRIYEILGYAADDKGFLKSKRIIGDKEAIELQDFLKSLSLNLKKKNEDLAKLCSNEWSEEEYGRLFDIEHYLDGTLQLSPDRKIACIVFLKSLRSQPKHEWSEEEKMDIELLIALLRGKVNPAEILDSRKESIITFLKSLHLQPKQEWSEEDKDIIANAIKQLYRYADSYHNASNYTREKEVRKVAYELKSLSPSRKPNEVRYYEAWGVPKINGVPVPTETQTADISGNVKLKGWVKRKTADGTLRLYESKSCEDRGIWVPPWALKDSWKVCTTDDPIEVEITLKQL